MRYPHGDCNPHIMNDTAAAALSRIAIANLSRRSHHPVGGRLELELVEPPDQCVMERCVGGNRYDVEDEVSEFLGQCRMRRVGQPQLQKVKLDKRPKWDGKIVSLTPVRGDAGRACCAVIA